MTIIATLLIYNSQKPLQKMKNKVGLTFSVGDTISSLQLVLGKTIRIGDSKYHS